MAHYQFTCNFLPIQPQHCIKLASRFPKWFSIQHILHWKGPPKGIPKGDTYHIKSSVLINSDMGYKMFYPHFFNMKPIQQYLGFDLHTIYDVVRPTPWIIIDHCCESVNLYYTFVNHYRIGCNRSHSLKHHLQSKPQCCSLMTFLIIYRLKYQKNGHAISAVIGTYRSLVWNYLDCKLAHPIALYD